MTDVGDHAGVDVSRPGGHQEAGERREAHAGVPAGLLARHGRGQAGAGPQVTGDQAGPGSQDTTYTAHYVLVTRTVEPVPGSDIERDSQTEKYQLTF